MPRIDVWDEPKKVVELSCGLGSSALQDKYALGRTLGTGGFGVVRLATDKEGNEFACKSIKKQLDLPNVNTSTQERHLQRIKTEVAVLRRLRGTVSGARSLFFAQPWAQFGVLWAHTLQHGAQ